MNDRYLILEFLELQSMSLTEIAEKFKSENIGISSLQIKQELKILIDDNKIEYCGFTDPDADPDDELKIPYALLVD